MIATVKSYDVLENGLEIDAATCLSDDTLFIHEIGTADNPNGVWHLGIDVDGIESAMEDAGLYVVPGYAEDFAEFVDTRPESEFSPALLALLEQ